MQGQGRAENTMKGHNRVEDRKGQSRRHVSGQGMACQGRAGQCRATYDRVSKAQHGTAGAGAGA